jgi:hypothetical protein
MRRCLATALAAEASAVFCKQKEYPPYKFDTAQQLRAPFCVLYINLSRRHDRNEGFLESNASSLDQAVEAGLIDRWFRMEGVDGNAMVSEGVDGPKSEFSVLSQLEDRRLVDGKYLPKTSSWGQVGCALSHRQAWMTAATTDLSDKHNGGGLSSCPGGLLILEDDAVVAPDFAVSLNCALDKLHADFGVGLDDFDFM